MFDVNLVKDGVGLDVLDLRAMLRQVGHETLPHPPNLVLFRPACAGSEWVAKKAETDQYQLAFFDEPGFCHTYPPEIIRRQARTEKVLRE
jgi:hypothetical protein